MKELLNELTIFIVGIIKLIPIAANATMGAIGDFLDAFGYAKAIIIGIFTALAALIAWILKKMNR